MLRTRLVAEHPSFANGSQQEVVWQELQPPHPCVLLSAHVLTGVKRVCHVRGMFFGPSSGRS